jgi:hypothetical protein
MKAKAVHRYFAGMSMIFVVLIFSIIFGGRAESSVRMGMVPTCCSSDNSGESPRDLKSGDSSGFSDILDRKTELEVRMVREEGRTRRKKGKEMDL